MIMVLAVPATPPAPAQPAPTRVEALARAEVTVLRSATASERTWTDPSERHRREMLIRHKDGTATLLRLIEHE